METGLETSMCLTIEFRTMSEAKKLIPLLASVFTQTKKRITVRIADTVLAMLELLPIPKSTKIISDFAVKNVPIKQKKIVMFEAVILIE